MSANHLELGSASAVVAKPAAAANFRAERRKRIRTTVHWPILLFRDAASGALETITRDLSSNGFYCLSGTPIPCGEHLWCELRVPTHHPFRFGNALALRCRVQVVRSEIAGEGVYGIACRIEDYHLASEL